MHLRLLKLILITCTFSFLLSSHLPAEKNHKADEQDAISRNKEVELITGVVLDKETNLPIENATVRLVRFSGREKNQAYGEELANAKTNRSGKFGIPKRIGEDYYSTFDNIHICAPGYESLYYQGNKDEHVVVSLGKGRPIRGTVINPEGNPIAHALVGSLIVDDSMKSEARKSHNQFYCSFWDFTNHDGVFQLDGVREGFHPLIQVVADGYAEKTTGRINPDDEKTLTITLSPGGTTLKVTILNEDGTPASFRKAHLTKRHEAGAKSGNSPHHTPRFFLTDKNGQFSIRNLSPGKYHVFAYRKENDWKKLMKGEHFFLEIQETDTQNETFQLSKPQKITGKVIDIKTKQGIPNVPISSDRSFDTITDENGEFTSYVYPYWYQYKEAFRCDVPVEYTGIGGHRDLSGSREIDYLDDDPNRVIISLVPTEIKYQKVDVQFLTPDGKPLVEKLINLIEYRDEKIQSNNYVTGSNGNVTMSLNTKSTFYFSHELSSSEDNNTPTKLYALSEFDTLGISETITLKELYPLKGRLVAQNGATTDGCFMRIYNPVEWKPFTAESKKTNPNPEGYFHTENIFPGNVKIEVYPRRFIDPDYNSPVLTFEKIIPSNQSEAFDFGDIPISISGNFIFNLIYPEETTKHNVRASLKFNVVNGFYDTSLSENENVIGGFNQNLKGPIQIDISSKYYETITLNDVAFKTQTIDIPLKAKPEPDHFMLNAFDNESGEIIPFVEYILQYIEPGDDDIDCRSNHFGSKETPINIKKPKAGDYILSVIGCNEEGEYDQRMGYTSFQVKKNQPIKDINITLSKDSGKKVAGKIININKVKDITGKVQISKDRFFINDPLIDGQETTINPDGTFSFSRVPPGDYFLKTKINLHTQDEEMKITIGFDEDPPFYEIPVYAYATIDGHFTGLGNLMQQSFVITLTDQANSDNYSTTRISKQGHFKFYKVLSGKYRLNCPEGIHYNIWDEKLDIEPGKNLQLNYDLPHAVAITSGVIINGKRKSLMSKEGQPNTIFSVDKNTNNNERKFFLSPGTYLLKNEMHDGYVPVASINIPDKTKEYHFDLDVRAFTVSINFETPDSVKLPKGSIPIQFSCMSKNNIETSGNCCADISWRRKFLYLFIPGTYTFQADINEEYHINSGPIEITEGENNITLKIKTKTGEDK